MSTIRASEIGTYLYCNRAWFYVKKGYQPGNPEELAAGTEIHQEHTRSIMASGCLRLIAYSMLIAAFVLLAIYLTDRLI
jgi:hypothetical protein